MLSLPLLAHVTSGAIAAAITASVSYGHYTVATGPDGSGLMPPASILRPDARPGAMLDPVAEIAKALAAMKQEEAKAERTRAMIDWLTELRADVTVQRFETGLVYDVRHASKGGEGEARQDFVAVPFGPEMPFAVSLSPAAGGDYRLEGVSCTVQQTLGTVAASDGPEAAEEAALSHAKSYLTAPDAADPGLPADCLMVLLKRG